MHFFVYKKDSGGMIDMIGKSDGWESKKDCAQYYFGDHSALPIPSVVDMVGWPHEKVEWYGDVGIGID